MGHWKGPKGRESPAGRGVTARPAGRRSQRPQVSARTKAAAPLSAPQPGRLSHGRPQRRKPSSGVVGCTPPPRPTSSLPRKSRAPAWRSPAQPDDDLLRGSPQPWHARRQADSRAGSHAKPTDRRITSSTWSASSARSLAPIDTFTYSRHGVSTHTRTAAQCRLYAVPCRAAPNRAVCPCPRRRAAAYPNGERPHNIHLRQCRESAKAW
jgi:hypothetical protein